MHRFYMLQSFKTFKREVSVLIIYTLSCCSICNTKRLVFCVLHWIFLITRTLHKFAKVVQKFTLSPSNYSDTMKITFAFYILCIYWYNMLKLYKTLQIYHSCFNNINDVIVIQGYKKSHLINYYYFILFLVNGSVMLVFGI